jgi:hypothetical protein
MAGSRGPLVVRGTSRVLGSARGIDCTQVNTDTIINLPATISKYQITAVLITNASTTPVLAQLSAYTAAAAGGTNIVAAAVITALSATTVIQSSTLAAGVVTTAFTANPLYARVTVANVGALTVDVYIIGTDLSGP